RGFNCVGKYIGKYLSDLALENTDFASAIKARINAKVLVGNFATIQLNDVFQRFRYIDVGWGGGVAIEPKGLTSNVGDPLQFAIGTFQQPLDCRKRFIVAG